ncbi:DUF6894 family protein [Rhizobium phaseoli]|uniref:DUF6894 family protein n=1 Tax=Rhizobium phaseoli TaxID=396 RepID=UPI0004D66E83|nr:hypothetical protein [Rhizobium phaseoli]KEC71288.1 hypothetical protein RLPCCGM1_p0019 [Rhizobium leguminosarum bv. phaseoli CCGM1]
MATYYFHIRHADHVIVDFEGSAFPDLTAARQEAVESLREMVRHALMKRGQDIPIGIDISDAHGALAAEVDVAAAIPEMAGRLR